MYQVNRTKGQNSYASRSVCYQKSGALTNAVERNSILVQLAGVKPTWIWKFANKDSGENNKKLGSYEGHVHPYPQTWKTGNGVITVWQSGVQDSDVIFEVARQSDGVWKIIGLARKPTRAIKEGHTIGAINLLNDLNVWQGNPALGRAKRAAQRYDLINKLENATGEEVT